MGRCAKVLLHAIYTLDAVCYLQPLETLMFIDCERKKGEDTAGSPCSPTIWCNFVLFSGSFLFLVCSLFYFFSAFFFALLFLFNVTKATNRNR